MAISSADVTAGPFLTNGSTVEFPFTFRTATYGDVEGADQLRVILVNLTTGAETVLTRGVSANQYSIALNGDQDTSPGGVATTVSTYATGYAVYVRIAPSYTQQTELTSQTGYNGPVHEAQFDQFQRQLNDLKDKVRRVPLAGIQIGESFNGEITGTPTAGYIPQINAGLTGFDWVANNGSSNLVTAAGSTTAISLANRFAQVFRPEDYGAVGDGTANDTAAFVLIFALMDDGDAIELKPGAIYSVTNLPLPYTNNGYIYNGMYCPGGMATIKARSGGSSAYMVASSAWVTATKTSTEVNPWFFEGVIFDANSIADWAFVNKSYLSHFNRCQFHNGVVGGCLHTRQNQDASVGAVSYLAETRWTNCYFRNNGTYGLRSQGTAADDTDAPTDCFITDCAFNGNDVCDYNIYLGNAGGWALDGNHAYSSSSYDYYIKKLARIGSMTGNTWEDQCAIEEIMGTAKLVKLGGSNNYWEGLTILFKDDTSAEVLDLSDDFFSTSRAGTDAQLTLTTTRTQKTLIVRNTAFRATTPIVRTTAGTIVVIEGRDGNGDMGLQYWDDGAAAGPIRRSVRRSVSPAASDVIGRDTHEGNDSAGNVDVYSAVETVITDPTSGSEDAQRRWKQRIAGTETTVFTLSPFLAQSIAGGVTVGLSLSGEGTVFEDVIRYSGDSSAALISLKKARGTIASPADANQFDGLGQIEFQGYGNSGFREGAAIRAFAVAADPSNTDMESDLRIYATPAGSVTATEILRARHSLGVRAFPTLAIPAGGVAGSGFTFSSTQNFGVFFGSGAPSLSAAQGSIYLRSDGSSTSTRMYVNTNGTTGWTAVTTAT